MTVRTEIRRIPNGFGSHHSLEIFRFGVPGAHPRVYLQAGIHTEELPGPLVLHHLKGLLAAIEDGNWLGEVILVPFANPIGLAQAISGNPIGRLDLASGMNFNTGWPCLPPDLGGDRASWLSSSTAVTGLGGVRLELLRLAEGADVVLDLHCCMEPSVAFAFVAEGDETPATRLASALGLDAVFTLPPSGSASFMDAVASVTDDAFIATIELRGHQDIGESRTLADAQALKAYLAGIGMFGVPADTPDGWEGPCTSYESATGLPAPAGGLFLPARGIRETVDEGDLLGEILLPVSAGGRDRIEIRSPCKGIVLSHADPARILHPGATSHVILPLSPPGELPPAYFDASGEWA